MLLKSLKLKNFRQFKGEQSITFSTDPDRNVTVIMGENGSGKTTLAQAFTWCLYGDTDFTDKAVLCKSTALTMKLNSEEKVCVELALEHNERDYICIREQKYIKDKEQVDGMRDSNNFFEFISEDEKIKTAKKILCFMYILNPYHIMAYLQSVDGAIENIKNWVNNIPKNESFEIKQKGSVKRHIPLYDLPLSAGIGNDSFENIPYVDFETENMICDFALKVSGNSMEPKVPNGSIVLVERNAKIDDGQIGAFYYNGKVYCKFMKHEKGETFLCSYNSAYLPIKIGEEDELFPYGKVVEIIANFIET